MCFVVKNTTRISFLDYIAPFTCRGCKKRGMILCECCKNYITKAFPEVCPRCGNNQKKCSCSVKIFAVDYREGILKQLVEDYKFKSIRSAAKDLAELIAIRLTSEFYQENINNIPSISLVPLPSNRKHVRERGFDHTKLIARHATSLCNSCNDNNIKWNLELLLSRKSNTVQVGSDLSTRQKQAKKAYELDSRSIRKNPIDQNKIYILFDDIWTTGSSMEAGIELLSKAGAQKIFGAVLLIPRKN